MDKIYKHECELGKEQFGELMKFVGKTNFKEKKEELEAFYSFYADPGDKNIDLLKKSIEAQKNCTRALWQKYEESCPDVDCTGLYGGVNNSQNNTSRVTEERLNKFFKNLTWATLFFLGWLSEWRGWRQRIF